MYARVANDFSPVTRYVYNAGASAIAVGQAVMRAPALGACAVQDPVTENSPTRYVLGVVLATASISAHQENFLGIALKSATTSTWFPICVGGPCQVIYSASVTVAAGAALGVNAAAAGYMITIVPASTIFSVPCVNLQAQTKAAGGLYDAFIEPVKLAGGGSFFL